MIFRGNNREKRGKFLFGYSKKSVYETMSRVKARRTNVRIDGATRPPPPPPRRAYPPGVVL